MQYLVNREGVYVHGVVLPTGSVLYYGQECMQLCGLVKVYHIYSENQVCLFALSCQVRETNI
jgi:hypothetical protein